jgi:signal transduction histidine kinase
MGLSIMRERAQALGAQFDLQTAPGQGTEIRVIWERGTAAGEAD